MDRLEVLRLDNNTLTGSLPLELNTLTNLNRLSMQSNQVTGDLDGLLCENGMGTFLFDQLLLEADCKDGNDDLKCYCCTCY